VNLAEQNIATFIGRFGEDAFEDALQRLTDMQWNGQRQVGDFTLDDVHQINACNHVITGIFTLAGESFTVIFESGDRNGTDVISFGASDDIGPYKPEPPVVFTFVPRDPLLKVKNPGMYLVYLAWTQTDWFKAKVRGYNYDRHFQPGGKTEDYYRTWAASKGMVPEVQE
jgi:hypothetical protein